MKKKTIVICSLVFACLATALWTGLEAHGAQRELAGKMIRLHVIANSNSQEDQDRKLTVRDAVLEQAEEILRQAEDVEEAQTRLEEALPALEEAAEETLRLQGCSDSVSASLSWERYPTREYATFRLPSGQYLSLRLTIGQGAGQASSGGFLYLLLANPASTFLMVIGRMTGRAEASVNVSSWFGSHGDSLVIRNWVGVSLALQIAAAALLIWASVKVVEKKRGR